jgi:hypothetical protein
MLPPGCDILSTYPEPTGSITCTKTMGIVRVAIEAAVEDVLHQDMYEVLFTLLRIFSAFRKFGAPNTCELGDGHPPFCAKQL